MAQNNHEIFRQHMDTSDGKGADGVSNPDLQAKSDTIQLKKIAGVRQTSQGEVRSMGNKAADAYKKLIEIRNSNKTK